MSTVNGKEKMGKACFAAAAVLCVAAVAVIFAFLIFRSLPAFRKLGFLELIGGEVWSPDRLDTYDAPLSGIYGIRTMIVGTLCATAGALLVGGIPGYFAAVFLAFYCPRRLKGWLISVIRLLAGIPSVVYGFFGIAFLLPVLSYFAPNNGSGLLATSVILGIMILPTVVSVSRSSLEAVPRAYYEASVAMGATHSETVFRVMRPAAGSGIAASFILGIGRALGETMAVVMVAGNAPTYPGGLFGSFRVLTANIVMEMGYAGEVQEGALIATGVVLLLFVLLVNLLFGLFSATAKKVSEREKNGTASFFILLSHRLRSLRDGTRALLCKLRGAELGRVMAITFGILTGAVLFPIIGFIFLKGVPVLLKNPSLIWGKYVFGGEDITVLPAIVTTLYTVVISLLIAVPIGIMTAVYLNEYAKKTNPMVRWIRSAIDILSGVPSIVYGLFGMVTFVKLFGGAPNILAGSLTVSIMLLPVLVRTAEESLKAVPAAWRMGSLALGAGKLRTVLRIVLPGAAQGILSAVILCMGRVISESAPFLYTMGSAISSVPKSVFDGGATLAVALYQLSGEGWYLEEAYGAAVVLIVIVLVLNLIAGFFGSRSRKKRKGRTIDEK